VLSTSTVYFSTNVSKSIEEEKTDFILPPRVSDNLIDILYQIANMNEGVKLKNYTKKFPFDYRVSFGIRKLARFDYERKPFNYYDGNEVQLAYTAPGSAVPNIWEYQFHIEKERWRGEPYNNHRFFIKHTGNYHVFKVESRKVGKINLNYKSADIRGRFSVGKKFHVSAGAIVRAHKRAYGYNPAQNRLEEVGWKQFAYERGYNDDVPLQATLLDYPSIKYPLWMDDLEFSKVETFVPSNFLFLDQVLPDLLIDYNKEELKKLPMFAEISPIVGLDFYHFKKKFWLHAYGNLMPYHTYFRGDKDKSYLNRNNWEKGVLKEGLSPKQWLDYSAGWNMGWNIKKNFGVFIDSEYSKMWASELFNSMLGINYQFK
jgi:hypothetical protein